jgi:aldose 1-epimerase
MTAGDVVLPSGRQFEIALGDQRVVVVEVGGGLRSYAAGGADVLDGYAAAARCTSGRGQVLIPWPNRIEDGRYDFDGTSHSLPLTEVPNRNAIHGLVRWAAWAAAEHEPHRVVMAHVVHPQPGYPFSLSLSIEYSLSDAGLTVRTTATNAGDRDCPYGCGAHPYLTAGTGTVDTLELRIPAATVLRSDERGLPTGSAPVAGTDYDFRTLRAIGGLVLDNAFTDLERDAGRVARVELRDPESGAGPTLWMDEAYPYVMVFSGDPLPDVARRALAVEPMSCPPNAFRSGESLVRLAPGESHTATWGITSSAA